MRAPLVACLLLATAGAAGAVAPVDTGGDVVGSHSWFAYGPAFTFCNSEDPVLGVVSTALTSRLTRTPAEGGTLYSMHLDANPVAGCAGLDFAFTSPVDWPAPGESASGSIIAACGASGSLWIPQTGQGRHVQIQLHAPAECGLPFVGYGGIVLRMQDVVQGTAVCTPLVVLGCTGADQGEYYMGCPEYMDRFAIDASGITIVSAGHQCDWMTQEEYGYAGDGFGIVTIRGTSDSCTLTVSDSFLGVVSESFDCPAELGAAVDGQDWSRVLP